MHQQADSPVACLAKHLSAASSSVAPFLPASGLKGRGPPHHKAATV